MASFEPGGIYDKNVMYEGVTTSAGNVGKTTLIDSGLTQGTDYWKNMVVLILSGDSSKQLRRISGFDAASDTITVETAFASRIASGTIYAILSQYAPPTGTGDATAANQELILGDVGDASARTYNCSLNSLLAIPDRQNDTAYRFLLDTIFHDNFDDEVLSTLLWDTPVVTGSTTVTESSAAPDTLRIQNAGAGTAGEGYLPTVLKFSKNLSIRTKIELFRGSLATDGERCDANVWVFTSDNDYVRFGPYRDTSETINTRARVVSNIGGAGAVTTDVDAATTDGIAREYRIDVHEKNVYLYIDDILVHSLESATLLNYIVKLYASSQSNTDIIDVRFDYCKVNRISDDYREVYKKLLQIQGGTDSIGTIINTLNNILDLNYIRGSTTADGTEQTIYENTNTRPFIFRNMDIDLSNMAAGDTTVIKKYAMIDGTNYRLIRSTTYNDAQTLTGIIVSGNEGGVAGVKVTLQQTAGTNRAYPWTYYDEAA